MPSGPKLTVTYKGGEQTIVVGPKTPIVALEPGARTDLKPGAAIIARGPKQGDGSIDAAFVLVGKDGLVPPNVSDARRRRFAQIDRPVLAVRNCFAGQSINEGVVEIHRRQPDSRAADLLFTFVMIKPSHYDDDGYPIQWISSAIPSNTLACLNGLAEDALRRRAPGPGVDPPAHLR